MPLFGKSKNKDKPAPPGGNEDDTDKPAPPDNEDPKIETSSASEEADGKKLLADWLCGLMTDGMPRPNLLRLIHNAGVNLNTTVTGNRDGETDTDTPLSFVLFYPVCLPFSCLPFVLSASRTSLLSLGLSAHLLSQPG
jgi:hypothetical protein